MKGTCSRAHVPTPPCRAFTLIELLVVLAVVAVLFSLHLSALAGATRQTRIAQCASNLRQFSLATILYAHENNNTLPTNAGTGNWPWDMAWRVGDQLNGYGAPWQVMYCPGTAPRFTDSDNVLFYNYAPNNVRVVGYAMTYSGTSSLDASNLNATLTPPAVLIAFNIYRTQLAADRVLLADATISSFGQNNEALRNTYNYTAIVGGTPKVFTSPHLAGKLPVGGNLGMIDGHVEWRRFPNMHVRTTVAASSPAFWW